MWHAVSPVSSEHNPIIYEGQEIASVSVINAGPGTAKVWGWNDDISDRDAPDVSVELRPGNNVVVSARLMRAHLHSGSFCAIAWRVLGNGT